MYFDRILLQNKTIIMVIFKTHIPLSRFSQAFHFLFLFICHAQKTVMILESGLRTTSYTYSLPYYPCQLAI
jgi:hypothetical protein